MNKIFYFDTETTGLDPKVNDIIQLAYLIEISGVVKERGNILMQPFNYNTISPEALSINKRTVEELKTFMTPQAAYVQIQGILKKYVDRYNTRDKFIPAGYNVRFDIDMLKEFFIKNGDKYFGAFFDYHFIDPMPIINCLKYKGTLNIQNAKLVTACQYFKININAHDALADIEATREVLLKLMKEYIK